MSLSHPTGSLRAPPTPLKTSPISLSAPLTRLRTPPGSLRPALFLFRHSPASFEPISIKLPQGVTPFTQGATSAATPGCLFRPQHTGLLSSPVIVVIRERRSQQGPPRLIQAISLTPFPMRPQQFTTTQSRSSGLCTPDAPRCSTCV